MSAAPSEKSPVEPRDWSRAEVKDGVCTIILILTKVEQLFDTDVPVPSEFVALDSDVLGFFTHHQKAPQNVPRIPVHRPASRTGAPRSRALHAYER